MKTSKFIETRAFLKRNLPTRVCSEIGWPAGTNQEVTGWRPKQRVVLLDGSPVSLDYISSIRDYYVERMVNGNLEILKKYNEDVTDDYRAECD